jgi:hypothetical protein
MNQIAQLLKEVDPDARRAVALAALKEVLSYTDKDGEVQVPGDADFQAGNLPIGLRDLAAELHRALRTENEDGLKALLDRWLSANMEYQSGNVTAAMRIEIAQLKAAVEKFIAALPITSSSELTKRLPKSRPVGAGDARGLLVV